MRSSAQVGDNFYWGGIDATCGNFDSFDGGPQPFAHAIFTDGNAEVDAYLREHVRLKSLGESFH